MEKSFIEKMDDLRKRVEAFQLRELPGQPLMMHMGTLYLVNDLWRALQESTAEARPATQEE